MPQTEPEAQGDAAKHSAGKRISYLEQALWKTLSEAATAEDFAKAWLGLQCRFLPGATGGIVILGVTPEKGPFAPAALWPDKSILDEALSSAIELSMAERRPVAEDGPLGEAEGVALTVHPLLIGGKLCGAAGLRLDPADAPQAAEALRQLRWGVGWIEALLRREESDGRRALVTRAVTARELVAGALEQTRFKPACTAIVTDLALRLDCDQVAIGFLGDRSSVKVAALSHSAQFGRRMNLVRRIGNAMDEAVDQEAAVLWPLGEEWEYRITQAHGDLAETILASIPTHRTNDCVVFDPSDPEQAIAFNPLACHPGWEDRVTSGVVTSFKKIYDSWGPRLEDTLRNTTYLAVEHGGTLFDVLRILTDDETERKLSANAGLIAQKCSIEVASVTWKGILGIG